MTAKGKPAVATAGSLERFRMTAENVQGSSAALRAKQVRNFRSPSMARIELASARRKLSAFTRWLRANDYCLPPALGPVAPVAVVVDTLNRSIDGSESGDRDMGAYLNAADAIREAFGCVVPIIHHCGHEGTRPRGHGSIMGTVDAQIAVKRDEAGNVSALVEEMKDGPDGAQITSRLEAVEVGLDEDGEPISSCIIVPIEGAAAGAKPVAGPKLTKAAKIALRALRNAIGEVGDVPVSCNHIPAGAKCVRISQWRDCASGKAADRCVGNPQILWPRQNSRPADCGLERHHRFRAFPRLIAAQSGRNHLRRSPVLKTRREYSLRGGFSILSECQENCDVYQQQPRIAILPKRPSNSSHQ
jgi:AAA domain